MSPGRAHVELSLEVGSEPITGSVAVGAGSPEPFSGWIELTAAIELARLEPDSPGAEAAARKVQGGTLV